MSATQVALPARHTRSVALGLFGLSVIVVCAFVMVAAGDYPVEAALPCGIAALVLACGISVTAARTRFGTARVIGACFFFVGSVHALVGYFSAGPSEHMIWIPGDTDASYRKAFLIVSFGLMVVAIGYAIAHAPRFGMRALDERRFIRAAVPFAIIGILLTAYVVISTGYLPLLSDIREISSLRFLNGDDVGTFAVEDWVLQRAMDILTYTLPLFIVLAWRERRVWAILLAVAEALALLIPARRANVISVLFTVALMAWAGKRLQLKRVVIGLAMVLVLYYSTQFFFIGVSEQPRWNEAALSVVGSALPEVRDLGWMLAVKGDERLWGATLIQPFVPLPIFVSDWKRTHNMGYVTIEAMGLRRVREIGGLRLTLAGEAYLNLDWPGVALVCFLVGVLIGKVEMLLHYTRSQPWRYVASLLFTWLACWIYLAGTQALGTVKVGLLVLAVMGVFARRQSHSPSGRSPSPPILNEELSTAS